MTHSALLGLLLLCPQEDPGRSTPEKTVQRFMTLLEDLSSATQLEKIVRDLESKEGPARTDRGYAKLLKDRKSHEAALEGVKTLTSKYDIVKRSDGKEGRVIVDSEQKLRRRDDDFSTGKVREIDQTLPHRHVLRQVGGLWLVEEHWRPCSPCHGGGKCWYCEGSGLHANETCFWCKGKKSCVDCGGLKMFKSEILPEWMVLKLAAPTFTRSSDLSTSKSAAQAFLDGYVHIAVETSEVYKIFHSVALPRFQPVVVPEIVDRTLKMIEKETASGKTRFANERPRIESVEEKGDTASAIVVFNGNWFDVRPGTLFRDKEFRQRLVFQKVEGRWLLDAEQISCTSCEGKGACGECKSTGKIEGRPCYSCEGVKKCASCKGTGWWESP